jgi:subtilisin family serine protease
MKIKLLVLVGILCLVAPLWAADGPPVGKDKLGFGFEPGLVAGKDFVAGQLVVGMQEGAGIQAVRSAAVAERGRVVKEIAGEALLLEFDTEAAAVAAAHRLSATPGVAFVERNGFLRIPPQPQPPTGLKGQKQSGAGGGDLKVASVSTDIATGYQWHLTVIRKTAALPALVATPPTVAVLDTGVDYTHSDLSGKVYLGLNAVANTMDPMDDHGHGTHCAGVIAAKAGNVFFGEGVCPNCKILAVKVLTSAGWGTSFDIAYGMAWTIANRNATTPPTKVVSMSLGSTSNAAVIATQVLNMKNAGMVLAAAAGNSNTTVPHYPGGNPNTALRVMATEQHDARAYFSNFSPATIPSQYNIAAPGYEIYSTVPGEGFEKMSGTSMATPIVAGAAALVWGQIPALTRDTLVSRLITNGKVISKGFAASTRRVDVRKAITAASATGLVGQILDPFNGLPASPNTTPDTAYLYLGTTLQASDATNRSGAYEMLTTATTATRTLKAARPAVAGSPAMPATILRLPAITAGIMAGPYTDAKPRARGAGYANITLDWWTSQPAVSATGCTTTCLGWELDLFVKAPSGAYYYWGSNGDLMTAPYVFFPRDSYDDLIPMETVVIGPAAANGVYKVFVSKQYSPNTNWANSIASVQGYSATTSIANYQAPPAACGTFTYWYVGNLTKNGNAYTWANVNTCTNTAP